MAEIAGFRISTPLAVAALTLVFALIGPQAGKAEIFGPLIRTSDDPCGKVIDRAERAGNIPAQLLVAIALNESGRRHADTGERIAWPWTVNNAGDGRFYETKAEAMAAVRQLWARGERNIDVGCMQINLMHHPDAFVSLDEAFDPEANVAYGARFLKDLRDAKRSWSLAVANYHSATPELGMAYRKKVFDTWTQARVGADKKHQEAVMAEFRERTGQTQTGRTQVAGVSVLRPRVGQDRFAWIAANRSGASLAQRAQSTGPNPQRLTWRQSAPPSNKSFTVID
jgi:hypothetical protein